MSTGGPNAPVPSQVPQRQSSDSAADVRVFTWAMGVIGILMAVALGGGLYWTKRLADEAQANQTRERVLVDFRLQERSGRWVERGELQGKILVVNFVFTGCSLACYEVSRHMARIQKRVADNPRVQLVSVSVDPRTDTPDVLGAFADRLKADANRWLFLTGDKAAVYHLIETSFLPKAPPEAPTLIPGNFDRAERIVLVDAEGRIRRYFDGMDSGAVAEVVEAIGRLERGAQP